MNAMNTTPVTTKDDRKQIAYFLTPELMPDAQTREQLALLAATPGVEGPVAVLPDVHWKAKNLAPTGTAVISRKAILPNAVDTGISCGMRIVTTPIPAASFDEAMLDGIFHRLMERIPCHQHPSPVVGEEALEGIFLKGARWLAEQMDLPVSDLPAMENGGCFPVSNEGLKEMARWVSPKALNKGLRCLGTLGDGNHFLEFQVIDEIFHQEAARRFGLQKGQLVIMLHTGSRSVGSKIMKTFLSLFRNTVDPDLLHDTRGPFLSLNAEHPIASQFVQAVNLAANFALANRSWITQQVRAVLREAVGDDSLQLPLLVDCNHVSIKQEQINGELVWVHRHGASYAPPPSVLQGHPYFSGIGQPLPVPGSMGHSSYIVVSGEGTRNSYHSVNHGAGRVLDKPLASRRFSEREVTRQLARQKIRLYRYGTDNIAEQAPDSFKDITAVLAAMQTHQLAAPVARLRPIAVLKG